MLTNRIDTIGATWLPVLYLIGTILATSYYFSDGWHSTGWVNFVATAIAGAIEIHSYLEQRRTRIAWRAYQKGSDELKDSLLTEFRVHLGILIALVSIQCFFGVMYTMATWLPGDTSLIPGVAQQIIRGCLIPVFFLGTGFLAPIALDANELLQRHNYGMLLRTVRTVSRQWDNRLRKLSRSERNLAPVASAMLRYEGDETGAVRIETIDRALKLVESPADTTSVIVSTSDDVEPPPARHMPVVATGGTPERLSEPALKREIRTLLEEDIRLTPKNLADMVGCAYSTANNYYHEIMDEWDVQEVGRMRRRA